MFTKKVITAICLIASTLAHCAAGDLPTALTASPLTSSNSMNFIGIKCSSEGNFALQSSIAAEPSAICEITFLYSEHPELSSQQVLNNIAEKLAAQSTELNDASIFEEKCDAEIANYVTPALKVKEDGQAALSPSRIPCNLIALHLILDAKKITNRSYEK